MDETTENITNSIESMKQSFTNKLVTLASKLKDTAMSISASLTDLQLTVASNTTSINTYTTSINNLDSRLDTLESTVFTLNSPQSIDLSSQTNTYFYVPTSNFNILLTGFGSLSNGNSRNIKCIVNGSGSYWNSTVNNSGDTAQNVDTSETNNAGIVYYNGVTNATLPYVIVETHGTISTSTRLQLDITFYKNSDILYTNVIAHYMQPLV